jgi:diadenosine hexaphosphate hydrolase (ATP-forming)
MTARMSRLRRRTRTPITTVEGAGGVVINHRGRVLMIRHKNGTWVFPKGHIEPGESKAKTAEREVAEEAGVRASILDPRMTWQTDYVNPRREARRITWYLLTTEATTTVQSEPLFPEGGFFAPAVAMRKLAFEEDRGVLRGVLKAAERAGLVTDDDLSRAIHVAATTRGRASAQRERSRGATRARELAHERAQAHTPERTPGRPAPPGDAETPGRDGARTAGRDGAQAAGRDGVHGQRTSLAKRRRRRGRPRRGSRGGRSDAPTDAPSPRDEGGEP